MNHTEQSSESTAGHTPGPWRFDDAGPLSGNIVRFDVLAGPESNPFRVCEIDDSAVDAALSARKRAATRDLANARLIAAAPNLLAACEAALLYCEDVDGCGGHSVPWPEEQLRTAIASAKGAQPS